MTTNESSGVNDATPRAETADVVLTALIKVVESGDEMGATLTLSLGGGVIYGELIPYRVWIQEWTDLIRGANATFGDNLANTLAEAFAEVDVTHQAGRGFLHLRGATYMTGDARTPAFPLWRGDINRINGWSFGVPA